MKYYINILFFSIIFFLLLIFSNCFLTTIKDTYEKYCFKKLITKGDHLTLSFLTTSYPKELIHVDLKYQKLKEEPKIVIYEVLDKEKGDYNSDKPLEGGIYELCFYSKKGKTYTVSMEFYSLYEDNNIKKLATDKEFKTINKDIKEMKNALNSIEINSRHINNKNFENYITMKILIDSIKKLTYLKIFVIALISLLQIYIIHKLFGPDKRVSTIKGEFSEKDSVL